MPRSRRFSPTLIFIGALAVAAGSAAGLLGIASPSTASAAVSGSPPIAIDLLLLMPVVALVAVVAYAAFRPPRSAADPGEELSGAALDAGDQGGQARPATVARLPGAARRWTPRPAVVAVVVVVIALAGLIVSLPSANTTLRTSSGGAPIAGGSGGGTVGGSGTGNSGNGGAGPNGSSGTGGSGGGSKGDNGTGGSGNGTGGSGSGGSGGGSKGDNGTGGSGNGTGGSGNGTNHTGGGSGGRGSGSGGGGSSQGGSSGSSTGGVASASTPAPPFGAWEAFGLIAILSIVAAAVLVPRVAARAGKSRAPAARRSLSGPPPADVPSAAFLAARSRATEALHRAQSNLDGSTDPHAVIVRLYGLLISALEPRMGENARYTAEEIHRKLLLPLGVRPKAAERLTRVFEEACYSSHPMGAQAVRAVRESIQLAEYDLRASRAIG